MADIKIIGPAPANKVWPQVRDLVEQGYIPFGVQGNVRFTCEEIDEVKYFLIRPNPPSALKLTVPFPDDDEITSRQV